MAGYQEKGVEQDKPFRPPEAAVTESTVKKKVEVQGRSGKFLFSVPEDWEKLRYLGSGAYASVVAFNIGGGEAYAVKKIERVFDHPVLALRTLRELRLLAHFTHPNILSLREFYVDTTPAQEDVYMCVELMGGDLNQLIYANNEMLTDYQVQCVLYQVVRGLLCLRKAHVVHRDIKPGNILLKADVAVKIGDLGLARTIDADDDGEKDVQILTEYVVTRYYRAPEVVLTATKYTYAVDIWSTGCIFGEMLTKKPLFEGKDSLDQIKKILSVIGTPTADDMSWIPRYSPSWKFMERCIAMSSKSSDEVLPSSDEVSQKKGLNLVEKLNLVQANPVALELLDQMLRFDPSRRVGVERALVHPYFSVFRALEDAEVKSAQSVAPVDWSFDRELCIDEVTGKPKPFVAKHFREAVLATRESLCDTA